MTKVTWGLMHHGLRKPKYLTEGPPWGIAEATCNCGLENIDTPVFWGQKMPICNVRDMFLAAILPATDVHNQLPAI